jgi:hypothetical protein
MPWLAGQASVRGISHVRSGAPCQDSGCVWVSPDGRAVVGAIADGGGSLDRSELGSYVAASILVAATAVRLTGSNFEDASERVLEEHWRTVVRDIRAMLSREAELTQGAATRDYGTTLIGFLAVDDHIAAMQIGDGFLVLGNGLDTASAHFRLVFDARPVEQAGEVVWLTSSLWEDDFRCTFIEGSVDLVAASTDGLEKVAISRREQEPFPGFFTPLSQRVGEIGSSEDLRALATSVISMKSLDNKVADDKTLLLARRIP